MTATVAAVRYFLLVYSQRQGELLGEVEEFDASSMMDGVRRRFEIERLFRDDPTVEVVLLGAESPEALRTTHRRYFMTPDELIASVGY